jgi:hypothetical protein
MKWTWKFYHPTLERACMTSYACISIIRSATLCTLGAIIMHRTMVLVAGVRPSLNNNDTSAEIVWTVAMFPSIMFTEQILRPSSVVCTQQVKV